MEKSRKPKIRFKGYNDDWEQRKLGEIATEMVAGGDIDKDLILDEGRYPVIANALTNDGIVGYYNEDYRIKAPAVTITGRGDVGHAKARIVDFTPIVRLLSLKSNHDVFFLENAINTLKIVIESTGVPQLTVPQLTKYEISFPKSLDEEEKIGVCFKQLDNLITLHQRKLDKLINVKKSMLEKMFPKQGSTVPEIRFNGFTQAWEQRKLGDIVGIYDGVHQTPNYQNSGVMFLSVENIATLKSSKFISEEDFKRDYKIYPQENDILMTRIGDVGTTNVVTDNGSKAYYVSLALLKYKSTDPYFLSNAIQSSHVQKGLANRTLKTAIPMKINKDEIGKVSIMLPLSATEQRQIGSYFHSLDNLITLHQRKLEKLKNIKKSMLEKMFV
ncbi:MAG: restriction endonuclease subunit S [Catenibacterium mitsuokai]|nr:restriction endonuclease subunit S [Catenibacterium mitsuokai]MDD6595060.1 restriction endonuclease subunit S [Catenibacterium mitsuokai]